MSEGPRPVEERALDQIVEEARADVGPELDWARLEAKLSARLEAEATASAPAAPSPQRRRARVAAGLVTGLAMAAAAALVVGRGPEVAPRPPVQAERGSRGDVERESAGALRSTERTEPGAGEVRIGGVVATAGRVLRGEDAIVADGARAVFERPGKVTWLVEHDRVPAKTRVKSAGEPLVLDLDQGAIEAQVVPVPQGEAFAVDVATERSLVRVAVHGTHLRVTRERTADHDRVIVDLTEGVVSIGVPPRVGVTYGTLVTAPAHVELDAGDLKSLRIDHGQGSVRAAIPLGPRDEVAREARLDPPAPEAPLAPPAPSKGVVARPFEGLAPASPHGGATPERRPEAPTTTVSHRDAIAKAVRDCAASRSRPGEVHVTISSRLRLHVTETGVVESAQFSPPLNPDIQACAAAAIYRMKLDERGLVTIPIEFSY